MKKLIIGLLALVLLLPLTACQIDDSGTHTPVPVKDMGVLWAKQEAPDDIMPAPGLGPAYRANIHQEGVENPWPAIEVSEAYLGSGSNEAHIYYRKYIETTAGETRNNIIKVIIPGKEVDSLTLYVDDVPQGITLTDGMQWSGHSARASVLVIELARDVTPGQYTFEIDLEVNGRDYGTVPCTIEVMVNTIPDNQRETSITIQPEPGSYLRNTFDEPSGVILKDIQTKTDVCDKEYFSPWYPSHTVKKGDPCLVVSGHIQNMHQENSEIAMYAEGYDTSGEQVAWTLDADHISGQIGLHLEYAETGEFTLHLNVSENTGTIRIYANNYGVTPP